jgi:uncharacterized LabA/DUF88 family protein
LFIKRYSSKKGFKILTVRTILFLDHGNIFHSLQDLKVRIDYNKFKKILAREDYLVGAFIYMGIPETVYPKKRRFLNYLTSQGYVIQSRPVKTTASGKKVQKQLDIFLYRDIVELATEDVFDRAVLVSGDSDFIEIVRKLKQLQKQIEIWGFINSMSKRLVQEVSAENVHYINEILSEIAC